MVDSKNFNNQEMPIYKVVTLGEGRVGKTSMILKFVNNMFDPDQKRTINASFLEKVVKINNPNGQEEVKLSLWDTAGQEEFSAMAKIYYKNADAAIIVYDITFPESLKKVTKWILELKEFSENDNLVIAIAGNKQDLQNQRKIQQGEGEQIAEQHQSMHFYTSAKSNTGIKELMNYIATSVHKINKGKQKKSNKLKIKNTQNGGSPKKKKEKECCQQ